MFYGKLLAVSGTLQQGLKTHAFSSPTPELELSQRMMRNQILALLKGGTTPSQGNRRHRDNHNSWCLASSVPSCSPAAWSSLPQQYFLHVTLLLKSLAAAYFPLNQILTPVPSSVQSLRYPGLALFFIALCSCQGGFFTLPCMCSEFLGFLCAFTGIVPFLEILSLPASPHWSKTNNFF